VKVSDSTSAALPQVELVSDVCCGQLAITEFLFTNKESVTSIHRSLCIVNTNAVVDKSTLDHWAKRVTASETEKVELFDLPHSGRPVTAVSPEMLQHANAIVREDQCITTQKLALSLSIRKGSISHIIQDIGYSKVCAKW